ncbi:hypothetical protein Z043_120706, partial [Scleropages formosus]
YLRSRGLSSSVKKVMAFPLCPALPVRPRRKPGGKDACHTMGEEIQESPGMDHIHVDTLVHQLMEEFTGPLDGLYKYEHGRHEPLGRRRVKAAVHHLCPMLMDTRLSRLRWHHCSTSKAKVALNKARRMWGDVQAKKMSLSDSSTTSHSTLQAGQTEMVKQPHTNTTEHTTSNPRFPSPAQIHGRAGGRRSSFTWLASSRVGEMMRARKPLLVGWWRWASSGRQKATVFPEPGDGLHLDGSGSLEPSCTEVLDDSWVELVLLLEFFKGVDWIRDVCTMNIDPVLVPNPVHLQNGKNHFLKRGTRGKTLTEEVGVHAVCEQGSLRILLPFLGTLRLPSHRPGVFLSLASIILLVLFVADGHIIMLASTEKVYPG